MFIIFFLFLVSLFIFTFFNFWWPDNLSPVTHTRYLSPATPHPLPATRHPLPFTRYPSPATRHPPPATRHPQKSPAGAQAIVFHSHCTWSYLNSLFIFIVNRPFYRYGGHIEFIRFMEYYGMPRGHSLSIYTGFLGKMRTSMTMFIGKKAIIITSKKGTRIFFSHYNLFLGKLKEKWSEKRA